MPYKNLKELLSSLYKSGRETGDATLIAYVENLAFEERLTEARQSKYNVEMKSIPNSDVRNWTRRHKDYLEKFIEGKDVKIPETFTDINSLAYMPSQLRSELSANQSIIRFMNLAYIKDTTLYPDFTQLAQDLKLYRGEIKPENKSQQDAKSLMQKVCDGLNSYDRANSPRFAAFAEDLATEINSDDWPNLLRDRLGMRHLQLTAAEPTIPVILMKYQVKDVLEAAAKKSVFFPFAVPTFMDFKLQPAFHPAPQSLNYGRALNLNGYASHETVIAEVIHYPIDYRPSQVYKIGFINSTKDINNKNLAKLRESHLYYLRQRSGDPNFGRNPSGD